MFRNPADQRKRRSPIKGPLLRVAGQSIRDEMLDVFVDKWLAYVIAVMVAWIIVATEWVRWLTHSLPTLSSALTDTFIGAAVTGACFYRGRKVLAYLRNLRQGLDGEVAVGQYLDEWCRGRGYKVLHDLKGNGFNVDHILVGPGGLFTIETKTISKPAIGEPVVAYDGESLLVDGFEPDRDPIVQAKLGTRHVAELLAEFT